MVAKAEVTDGATHHRSHVREESWEFTKPGYFRKRQVSTVKIFLAHLLDKSQGKKTSRANSKGLGGKKKNLSLFTR